MVPTLALLEARERTGGTIHSEWRDGFLLEHGPEAFHAGRPEVLELCRELGLEEALCEPSTARRRSFVVRRGQPVPVPDGLAGLAPTRLVPLLTTPLLSWRGRLRAMMDLVVPRQALGPEDDESFAAFVRRRLGREALDRLAQPLLGDCDAADPADLSLRAVLPHYLELEQRHGGLIRAGRALAAGPRPAGMMLSDSGLGHGPLVSLAGGLGTLTEALARSLPPGSITTSAPVRRLTRVADSGRPWRIERLDAPPLDADAVILATEAHAAARLLDALDPELALSLRSIPYASKAVVHAAYRRDQIRHPLDGSGLVVPASEGRNVFAASFTSVKFPDRAPEGTVLLRASLGGALRPDLLDQDDEALVALATADLADFLRIRGEPLLTDLVRHDRALPQYTLGHLDRVRQLTAQLQRHPGLVLAGNYLTGVGLADCIASGRSASLSVLAGLDAASRIAAA
jgi:oxygen-dependent protoporphyrinogen oxidase